MESLRFVLLLCVVGVAFGDVYLHVPRGSNNRLDEANRDRQNGNRLFDSQNNNRGGYNVGGVGYIEGAETDVSWTNQHSCNNPKCPGCEIVMQMMCDRNARDGTVTQTIPENAEADLDWKYGRHESYAYYQQCKTTERNKGLFTASQNLNGETARFTRQNPGGTRRGFECPEERDYYPYWRASPWMDVAIYTNNISRCEYYQRESQNVKASYYCSWDKEGIIDGEEIETAETAETRGVSLRNQNNRIAPITAEKCTQEGGVWKRIEPFGLPPPICEQSIWTRDNHNGNTIGGFQPTIQWAVTKFSELTANKSFATGRLSNFSADDCWWRIRYNITTGDYDGWNTFSDVNDRNGQALGLTQKFGYNAPFQNNPQVNFFQNDDIELQLAINTAQYGRTFQDRSHRFSVVPRAEKFEGAEIRTVQVQGKRGNIVQTYPATEYDFSPKLLETKTTTWLHFTWTGSNTNPNNNDGQGQNGSDRTNIVPLLDPSHALPALANISTLFNGEYFYLHLFGVIETAGIGGEMSELDDAATYFDPSWTLGQEIALVRLQAGNYSYMCSRNNNFSNRAQKGEIVVREAEDQTEEPQDIGYIVGGIASGIIVSLLVGVAIISLGKSMGASTAATAAKPI